VLDEATVIVLLIDSFFISFSLIVLAFFTPSLKSFGALIISGLFKSTFAAVALVLGVSTGFCIGAGVLVTAAVLGLFAFFFFSFLGVSC